MSGLGQSETTISTGKSVRYRNAEAGSGQPLSGPKLPVGKGAARRTLRTAFYFLKADFAAPTLEVAVAPNADVETFRSVSDKPPKSTCFARLPGRSRSQPRFFARNQGLISRMAVQWHQIGLSRDPREVFGRSSANASLQ